MAAAAAGTWAERATEAVPEAASRGAYPPEDRVARTLPPDQEPDSPQPPEPMEAVAVVAVVVVVAPPP